MRITCLAEISKSYRNLRVPICSVSDSLAHGPVTIGLPATTVFVEGNLRYAWSLLEMSICQHGAGKSYIQCSSHTATFSGTLDIKTLGGAGFASQRTTGEERHWDLTDYDGITLEIAAGDSKRYTFILKDELLPRNPENDREQASLSYEFDFYVNDALRSSGGDSFVFIPWKALKATYRGREREDATPIDLSHVKRVSIMNRRQVDFVCPSKGSWINTT